jgi:hypothetical protein
LPRSHKHMYFWRSYLLLPTFGHVSCRTSRTDTRRSVWKGLSVMRLEPVFVGRAEVGTLHRYCENTREEFRFFQARKYVNRLAAEVASRGYTDMFYNNL